MECPWVVSLADSARGGAETAGSTTSGSALSAGTPMVAPMGISGAGGSQASGSSVGFTHSLGSGGAVFSTGGDVVSSQRTPLLYLGVQRSMCDLSLLGELDCSG